MNLHALFFRLNHRFNNLSARFIKEMLPISMPKIFEGVSHTTTNDHLVDLIEQIFNQLDFIGHFSATKDCQEWALRVIKRLAKVF